MIEIKEENLQKYHLASREGSVQEFLCIVGTGDYDKTIQQILQDNEDAKKGFSPEAIIQAIKDRQIVKRIEEWLNKIHDGDWIELPKTDFQKVLDGRT